ncbi:hypothetical protein DBR32_14120 [Taibaiella sp. KBW10]|uniref:hypothetical protein n=1 Tax=Taibaiella sp. KBW10 TaxID=2153357 RepID=UPI000F59755E|nr:hypothetical protein [Taibaiella sp. KBW10]RQO29719.1 hypothetical protein DBR32_14120 [Taibaiella sp. KBW10]
MNEHNPIAFAISRLQEQWNRSVVDRAYKLVRWLVEKKDIDIFKGFLKLESTPHGSLEESFIVMLTPFESSDSYGSALLSDWLHIFGTDLEQGKVPDWVDYPDFKIRQAALPANASESDQITLLADMLHSFKRYEGKPAKMVVGLMPYAVTDHIQFAEWILKLYRQLPETVALMLIDDPGAQQYDYLFGKNTPDRISIKAEGLFDTGDIYRNLATSGNPDDPQVMFRTCLFEMGAAAKAGRLSGVQEWGDKALLATQSSGNKLFWASAHIVYAGFLFGFKESERIEKLLNNGLQICESMLDDEQARLSAVGMIAQFHSYKGAYLSILKKYKESIASFRAQADILERYEQTVAAIGAYQNALLVAGKHERDLVKDLADKGFLMAYPLEDELLRTSGFPVIAYYYLQKNVLPEAEKKEIEQRMAWLYTEDWQRNAKKHLAVAPEEYVS